VNCQRLQEQPWHVEVADRDDSSRLGLLLGLWVALFSDVIFGTPGAHDDYAFEDEDTVLWKDTDDIGTSHKLESTTKMVTNGFFTFGTVYGLI
jgi:hypothetical protein